MPQNPFIPDYTNPPPPPPLLYKYVVPERIDALEGGCLRFTPLLGTNDLFEVRQTFEQIAGPRFRAAFSHEADALDVDAAINEEFRKFGLDPAVARLFLGANYPDVLRDQMKGAAEIVMSHLNRPDQIAQLLDRQGGDLLALSLAEAHDSSVMWAHYAQNSAGFVIGFETNDLFFRQAKDGKKRVIHKIMYRDGKVDELLDDLRACLISKTTDWEYEREWRVYVKVVDADRVIDVGDETIHLMEFPASAVSRVIAGARTSVETVDQVKSVLKARYPNAQLTRMRADRSQARLVEVAVD